MVLKFSTFMTVYSCTKVISLGNLQQVSVHFVVDECPQIIIILYKSMFKIVLSHIEEFFISEVR